MENVFKNQNNVKEEFLQTKSSGTAKSNESVLNVVDEYEFLINKSIYDMNMPELKGLISQFKNSSINVIETNISILRSYVDFCIKKGLVYHMENRLTFFSKDDLEEFVSQQAIDFRYITREQLKEYQNNLYNVQDKLIIALPYFGARGRTQEDGTLEEVINLTVDSNSENVKYNILQLVKNNGEFREIIVPQELMNLILKVLDEDCYVDNNGMITKNERFGNRSIKVNRIKNTVFRVPGKDKFQYFESNLINSRMNRIQEWVNNEYITITNLYYSGMISMAKEILEKGEEIDYDTICEQFDYNKDYLFKLKNMVDMYIDKNETSEILNKQEVEQ